MTVSVDAVVYYRYNKKNKFICLYNIFKIHIFFELSLAKWTECTKSIKWHGQQRQQRGECYNATIGFDEGRKQENGQNVGYEKSSSQIESIVD